MMYFINLVLQFYSRKIFLEYLGTEILGLNSTANNLLQFLNLAELGIASAIAVTLYKPINEKDTEAIINIVSLQGMFYKRVAIVVIVGAVVLSMFFPIIFNKMELPIWYAYASFGVLLFSSLLSYFVNYRQILLTASMQEYRIQYTYRFTMIIKVVCQMMAMIYFSYPYFWWLVFEVLFTVLGSAALNIIIKKTFPFLKESDLSFKKLRRIYSGVLIKVKQIFIHSISSFALFQLSPLLIYFFTTLSDVTIYGNYVLIITGMTTLIRAVFNSIVAGIGNLLAQDSSRAFPFFSELFSLRFYVAAICCFLYYTLADNFITVWIGSEYIMPHSTLILLTITLFITLIRQTTDNYIYAFGLFSDIWAPITELLLNVVISIVLGYYCGINGVISATIISQAIIMLIWKPYFLFSRGMKLKVWEYWKLFIKHALLTMIVGIPSLLFINRLSVTLPGYLGLIVSAVLEFGVFGITLLIVMNLTKCSIISFERRIVDVLCKTIHHDRP